MLSILSSFSFAFLGVVLIYRRLDWKYGCVNLAVGTVGSFYPIAFIIPYLLIGWRLLQRKVTTAAEQNAATYSPFFIGKRHTGSGSSHGLDWIIAVETKVEIPPTTGQRKRSSHSTVQQEHTSYLVTKATSKVISGDCKQVIISRADMEDMKFDLDHVGWVNCKPDMSTVIQGGLAGSEHSCKELAINFAIQISCSRAYTYIKSMSLLRLNVMVYYAVMIFLGQMYEHYIYSIDSTLPLPWSILMMLNTIIAIEICLLQLGDLKDEDYTEELKGMRDMLQTCYEHLLTAYEIISSYFNKPVHVKVNVDLAKKPEQTGTQVVETVVDRIGRSSIFDNDFGYIRRICWVETKDGADIEKTYRPGYHGGLWQVDEAAFHKTQDTSAYPILHEKYDQIKSYFGIDWMCVKWVDLRMPLHCGLAAWLYMFTREEKIPLNIQEQADHWKRNYRPEAEVTADDFVKNTVDLEKLLSGNAEYIGFAKFLQFQIYVYIIVLASKFVTINTYCNVVY